IEDLKNLVGPDTAIMSLLNGIDSEKELGKVFGAEKVIYCVAAGMDATKIGNRLTYGNMGVLQIGERDGGVSERLRGVAALLANANIGYNVNTGMERTLWSKWVLNVGVNQASAVYGMCYGALQAEGPARDEMVAAMREAAAVATADGIPLGEDEITYWLGVIGTLSPDGMTSMRQDVLQGRKTEVEAFAGAVRKLGRKHGIPTPVNDRFFEAIRTMETGYGAT
ncbi:MAG: 2-dehydropantoate 2-reductase, partial [Lachnospiraceae bacterium]|nr:2-dehydropantoate 2-reductase [Lachnospiraceae bacterium]